MLLPGIAPLCGASAGGLLGCLRVFPASNVLAVPRVVGGVHVGEVQLRDAQNYADVWFRENTGQYEEPQDDDEQGDVYKAKLTVLVARDAPDVQQAIDLYRQHRYFVALFLDGNGLTKLVGSAAHPLRFTAGLNTGQRGGDANGYALSFAANQSDPAAFYAALDATPPAGRKVFSAGFTYGFLRTL